MEMCPPTKENILINLGWSAWVLVRDNAQNVPGIDTLEKIRINKYTCHILVTLMILVNGDVMELSVLFINQLYLPLLWHLYDNTWKSF